jgi:hypothetical protein
MPLLSWESELDEEESGSLTVDEKCTSSSDDDNDMRGFFLPRDTTCWALAAFLAIFFEGVESAFSILFLMASRRQNEMLKGVATWEALLALGVTQKVLQFRTGVMTFGD